MFPTHIMVTESKIFILLKMKDRTGLSLPVTWKWTLAERSTSATPGKPAKTPKNKEKLVSFFSNFAVHLQSCEDLSNTLSRYYHLTF